MVSKGQFLERPTLIPVGPFVMEGLSHRGDRRPLLLVLPPTPVEGGGMDHVVGAELAWAAAHSGFPTLRFNYRSVGGSQGKRGEFDAWVEDARAAVVVARDNTAGHKPLIASIGGSAAVALELLDEAAGVCLVSPIDIDVSALARPEVWLVVGQTDFSARLSVAPERLRVIAGADRTFQKNLTEVGRAAVEVLKWAEKLE